ncbi:hypothetical protein [Gordonia malaquae]|nr:hypothetical protein [Gordonia malaquae]
MNRLRLPYVEDLVGMVVPLDRARITTVGRAGDLAFPDNPYLHRRVLEIGWSGGRWWMKNVGSWTTVRFGSRAEPIGVLLGRGRSIVLPGGDTHVVFAASRTEYEVVVRLPVEDDHHVAPPPQVSTEVTIGPRALTLEQIQMLVAFAEPILRSTCVSVSEIASMRDVEQRLGWSSAKLRRKLDYLCFKLDDAGVAGLVSDSVVPASRRRLRLVEWALGTGVIDRGGLRVLDVRSPLSVETVSEIDE